MNGKNWNRAIEVLDDTGCLSSALKPAINHLKCVNFLVARMTWSTLGLPAFLVDWDSSSIWFPASDFHRFEAATFGWDLGLQLVPQQFGVVVSLQAICLQKRIGDVFLHGWFQASREAAKKEWLKVASCRFFFTYQLYFICSGGNNWNFLCFLLEDVWRDWPGAKLPHLKGIKVTPFWPSGLCSGVAATTMCYPLDTVRRQLMLDGALGFDSRYQGSIFQCCRYLWSQGGILPFYRGWTVTLMKSVPSVSITFLTKDILLSEMRKWSWRLANAKVCGPQQQQTCRSPQKTLLRKIRRFLGFLGGTLKIIEKIFWDPREREEWKWRNSNFRQKTWCNIVKVWWIPTTQTTAWLLSSETVSLFFSGGHRTTKKKNIKKHGAVPSISKLGMNWIFAGQ